MNDLLVQLFETDLIVNFLKVFQAVFVCVHFTQSFSKRISYFFKSAFDVMIPYYMQIPIVFLERYVRNMCLCYQSNFPIIAHELNG